MGLGNLESSWGMCYIWIFTNNNKKNIWIFRDYWRRVENMLEKNLRFLLGVAFILSFHLFNVGFMFWVLRVFLAPYTEFGEIKIEIKNLYFPIY